MKNMNFKIGQLGIVFEAPGEGAPGGPATEPAAHPVVAPWATADGGMWNVGEGDASKPWHASISEDPVRQHVEAKGYANPAELAMANWNLTKLQRGDPTVIGLPGADATPEQMGEFYGQLGRPDAPDGYEFNFAEGQAVDDGLMAFARSTFHEAGLSPKQAQLVADKWNEFAAQTNDGAQEQTVEANNNELAELGTRWGADLDKNKASGQRAVQALGLSEDLAAKIEGSIGSAALVELMATIGRKSDEGGFLNSNTGGDPNDPSKMTPEQAQAKINELAGDAAFQAKYTDKNNPGQKAALALMAGLYARI